MIALAAPALLVTLILFGAGPAGDRADFSYVNQSGIGTLDPSAVTWKQDIRIALNVWEGLTAYDPAPAQPIAAAAFAPTMSDDGLTYSFDIRPDARWSNGDPLTAGDFVRGWRRSLEPGTSSDYAYFLTDFVDGAAEYYAWRNEAVSRLNSLDRGSSEWRRSYDEHVNQLDERFSRVGIQAVTERRLRVRLSRPCPFFLDLCAFPTLLPIHRSIERLRVRYEQSPLTAEGLVVYDPQWTKPDYHVNDYPGLISNGPYRITDWNFKRRVRLAVNPFYREADTIACRTVDMLVYPDLNTAIMAYEAGDLDFLTETNVPYDHELARLAMTGQRRDFYNVPVFGTFYFLFNCQDVTFAGRRNPFVDARVRKAFTQAIDRRLVAEKVVARGERPADTLVPVDSIADYPRVNGLTYQPDEARRLLAEAGYPGGRGMPVIDILYNTGFQHGKICDALAEMWRAQLGVTVVPRGKEVKSFAEDRKQGRFMIARGGWYGDYADPTTFLDIFVHGNGNNDAGHNDRRFDQWLVEAAGQQDPVSRMNILARAERRLLCDNAPLLPLFQYTQLLAIKPYVSGLYPNSRLVFPFRFISVNR